jgi:hypothetical protein
VRDRFIGSGSRRRFLDGLRRSSGDDRLLCDREGRFDHDRLGRRLDDGFFNQCRRLGVRDEGFVVRRGRHQHGLRGRGRSDRFERLWWRGWLGTLDQARRRQ